MSFKFKGAPKCVRCQKSAYRNESIVYDGTTYHKNCFRCKKCNKVTTLSAVAMIKGTLYCKPCFKKMFQGSGGSYNLAFGGSPKYPGLKKPAIEKSTSAPPITTTATAPAASKRSSTKASKCGVAKCDASKVVGKLYCSKHLSDFPESSDADAFLKKVGAPKGRPKARSVSALMSAFQKPAVSRPPPQPKKAAPSNSSTGSKSVSAVSGKFSGLTSALNKQLAGGTFMKQYRPPKAKPQLDAPETVVDAAMTADSIIGRGQQRGVSFNRPKQTKKRRKPSMHFSGAQAKALSSGGSASVTIAKSGDPVPKLPQGLGVVAEDGVCMQWVIPRGSPSPIKKTITLPLSRFEKSKGQFSLQVYMGMSDKKDKCRELEKVFVPGDSVIGKKSVQIAVTINVPQSGLPEISARPIVPPPQAVTAASRQHRNSLADKGATVSGAFLASLSKSNTPTASSKNEDSLKLPVDDLQALVGTGSADNSPAGSPRTRPVPPPRSPRSPKPPVPARKSSASPRPAAASKPPVSPRTKSAAPPVPNRAEKPPPVTVGASETSTSTKAPISPLFKDMKKKSSLFDDDEEDDDPFQSLFGGTTKKTAKGLFDSVESSKPKKISPPPAEPAKSKPEPTPPAKPTPEPPAPATKSEPKPASKPDVPPATSKPALPVKPSKPTADPNTTPAKTLPRKKSEFKSKDVPAFAEELQERIQELEEQNAAKDIEITALRVRLNDLEKVVAAFASKVNAP